MAIEGDMGIEGENKTLDFTGRKKYHKQDLGLPQTLLNKTKNCYQAKMQKTSSVSLRPLKMHQKEGSLVGYNIVSIYIKPKSILRYCHLCFLEVI
jgi:hypothetical protein